MERRKTLAALYHLSWLSTPMLLAVVIYFVKPVFEAVPVVAEQQRILSLQQQNLAESSAAINAKQELLDSKIVNVQTRVEVLSDKVSRLERKVD